MKTRIWILSLSLSLFCAVGIFAQNRQLTLEDLNFGGKNYRKFAVENRYFAWHGDNLLRLDRSAVYSVNKSNGRETVLFSLNDVNASVEQYGLKKVGSLFNASFSSGKVSEALLTNGECMLLYDWQKKAVVWTGGARSELGELLDWNDQSKTEAWLKNDNLYVRLATGHVSQLTEDGSRNIVYGQAVHRDEFGIDKGTFWSPDGSSMAFYRMDQSMVTDYPQVELREGIAEMMPDKYPMAGQTSHKVSVGVYDVASGHIVYLKTGDATDRYFTNVSWSPDGRKIYMFELNRDQNQCSLMCYDALTGERYGNAVFEEKDDKYVEPLHPIVFLPWDEGKFILQSRRDGYNHLYLYTTDGKMLRQLTKGNYEVMDLLGFNRKERKVVIRANAKSPITHNIYSVSIASGAMQPLDEGKGVHSARLSESGAWLVDNYSEPDVPRIIALRTTGKKTNNTVLFAAADPWAGYDIPQYECGSIKAADGHTDLYYRMVKPLGFDPARKYPTIVYVYGGPHAHNVDSRWHYSSRAWETYMAGKGYLLFILDNRGSELRGKAFEQATFRRLGQTEMLDQMEGVKYLKSLPYVDADRMGVHGWSFGGFMTISLMVNYPEVFKVGVAGGPVIDWKWYEVMYGERYMDTPQANPEGYAMTSLLARAKDLKGKLQIIQGLNDKTVVPQHCLAFIDACIEAGVQLDFFVYPGEPHNMRGHKSVHLHDRISQYFDDYLK